MTVSSEIMVGKRFFQTLFAGYPHALELWDLWPSILDKPALTAFIQRAPIFKGGYLAMPEPRRYEPFLREVGHDPAAAETLRVCNFLNVWFVPGIALHHYYGLVGSVTNLLYISQEPFTSEQRALLYSTVDRLLRGGPAWHSIQHVPTATKAFYLALGGVKIDGDKAGVGGSLCLASRKAFRQRFGQDGHEVTDILSSLMRILTAAAAVRNGRQAANIDDSVESVHVLLSLFDTDLYSLPLVIREGRSGYELPE